MEASCKFYSAIPGFELVCGGISDSFTTYQIEGGSKMYLNLELREEDTSNDFGRFIQENRSGTIKKALHPQKWVELGDVRQMQPWFRYMLYLFGIKLFTFYSRVLE